MVRFPQFRLDDSVRALYQADAGLVDAKRANATHIAFAQAHGATILENTPVRGVRVVGDGVEVTTDKASKAGQVVGGDVVTVDSRTFEPNERVLANLRAFLEKYIPESLGPELYPKTCLYDTPTDREFVLGALPDIPQTSAFVGAGHGLKFASLVAKILSELAIDGKTQYPAEAFRLDRPALAVPAYKPACAM